MQRCLACLVYFVHPECVGHRSTSRTNVAAAWCGPRNVCMMSFYLGMKKTFCQMCSSSIFRNCSSLFGQFMLHAEGVRSWCGWTFSDSCAFSLFFGKSESESESVPDKSGVWRNFWQFPVECCENLWPLRAPTLDEILVLQTRPKTRRLSLKIPVSTT